MNYTRLIQLFISISTIWFSSANANSSQTNPPGAQKTGEWISSQKRLGFEENKGQFESMDKSEVDFVLFKAEVSNLNIWITKTGITYQFLKYDRPSEANPVPVKSHTKIEVPFADRKVESYRVDMILKGAHVNASNVVKAEDITVGRVNYYHAHSPNGLFDIRTYSKVTVKDIYPGIDWQLYFVDGKMEYDFIVHPFADPNLIQLTYEGTGSLSVSDSEIGFRNGGGNLAEGKLYAYQGNKNNSVSSNFVESRNLTMTYSGAGTKFGSNLQVVNTSDKLFSANVKIALGNYNHSETLVIDPQLVWGTYYGGPVPEMPQSIACDKGGNVFVSGGSFDVGFPVHSWGAAYYQATYGGGLFDCFFMCFTNDGKLNWATYYGGNEGDSPNAVICDANDHVYFTGISVMEFGLFVSTFPTQVLTGAFNQQVARLNASNAFLLRFDATNGVRDWGTFVADGETRAMTIDNVGNLYITGSGMVYPGVIRPGAYNDTTFAGGFDVLLLRFTSSGSLTWATNIGGYDYEEGIDVTTDESGNVYIVGSAHDSFPVVNRPGAFNSSAYTSLMGQGHIMRFDNAGLLTWASYYPGTEQTTNVLCDGAGNVYVTGYSDSTSDGPLQIMNRPGAYNQPAYGGGGYDCCIMEFDAAGALTWGTYYGGLESELIGNYSCGAEAAIDACGNVTMSLTSLSTNPNSLYTYSSCNQYTHTGTPMGAYVYLLKLTEAGVASWATYYGGNGSAAGWGFKVALDKSDNLFVTKAVYEPNIAWPLIDPGNGVYFDSVPDLNEDLYFAKFTPIAPLYTQSQVNDSACSCGSATITLTCGEPNYTYVWSNGSNTVGTDSTSNTITGLTPGTYTVTATSACNQTVTASFTILGVAAGINEAALSGLFSIFPNPAQGNFELQLDPKLGSVKIDVCNSLGMLVETMMSRGTNTKVELTDKPAGVYYIRITDEMGNLGVNRLVKL
ncbi:MAG: T9SS type A sorting domain-containing protein [Bacteroidetes bacterium]|nr:T9SS type A sorting domain-containing protein [Bacteroidota bacterium]